MFLKKNIFIYLNIMTVLSFSNQNSSLSIETDAESIEYNNIIEKITKKHVISIEAGKIETKSFIIKWSSGYAYIYDKLGKITLLEILDFNDQKQVSVQQNKSNSTTFYVTKGIYVKLHEQDDKFYIESDGDINQVIKIYKRGAYLVHEATNGDILELTSINNVFPKFNNLVISRVS